MQIPLRPKEYDNCVTDEMYCSRYTIFNLFAVLSQTETLENVNIMLCWHFIIEVGAIYWTMPI